MRVARRRRRRGAQAGRAGGGSCPANGRRDSSIGRCMAPPSETAAALLRNAATVAARRAGSSASSTRRPRGAAAARQARARPDGARHPPRPHRRAAEAARVPGPRPPRRADRRRLHRARGRPQRALVDAAGAVAARRSTPTPRPTSEQAFTVLRDDPELLEVRRNGEWLDMRAEELFRLARVATVAQILERDDFAKRFAAQQPISVLETAVPAAAGLRLGGRRAPTSSSAAPTRPSTCCSGRDVQRAYGQPEQVVLTMPILPGIDGAEKMSKSLGNHIGVTEPPEEQYGKTHAAARRGDGRRGSSLLAGRARRPAGSARATPSARWRAAIVERFHGAEAAAAAEEHFDRVFVAPRGARGRRRSTRRGRRRHRARAGADRRSVRALALGGAAAAGAGRRASSTARRWAPTTSTSRRERSTGASCRSASATSGACARRAERLRAARSGRGDGSTPVRRSPRVAARTRVLASRRDATASPPAGAPGCEPRHARYTASSARASRSGASFRRRSPSRQGAAVFENSTACAPSASFGRSVRPGSTPRARSAGREGLRIEPVIDRGTRRVLARAT